MMNFRFVVTFLFIILLSTLAKSENLCEIKIINKENRPVRLKVEIADTARERMTGLMNRKKLGENNGMLFFFPYDKRLNFWMKNTYIPLSIAYISRSGVVNEIYKMEPLDTSITYPSRKPAKFALEVNQGWFKKNNISAGSRIIFNGCVSK